MLMVMVVVLVVDGDGAVVDGVVMVMVWKVEVH
jgi:hypothetical protein